MLWDELNIFQTLESVSWTCKHQAAIDEAIPHQLHDVVSS